MTIWRQLARGTYVGFLPLIAAAVGAVGGIIASKKQKKAATEAKKAAALQLKAEEAAAAAQNQKTDTFKKIALYGGLGLAGLAGLYFVFRRK